MIICVVGKPPRSYLEWLAKEVSKHPIKYVREQGREHTETGKPLETNTHVDVVLEAKNLLMLVEMKFTPTFLLKQHSMLTGIS